MEEARASVKKQQEELEKLEKFKGKTQKLPDMVSLFRDMDATRMQIFKYREDFLDCDEVYKPLAEDSTQMRESMNRAQDMVVTTYKSQVSSLTKKVKDYQNKLKERDAMLEVQGAELDKLKKQFDEITAFNEEIFNDLFNLVGTESIKFSTNVEGQKIDAPLQDIQALLANESKVMKTIQDKYPEYFKDGVNVEGLKRRKFVLEKMSQMMAKFGKRSQGSSLGYDRAMTEMDATIKMMDKTIAANEGKSQWGSLSLKYVLLIVVAAMAVTGGLVLLIARRRRPAGTDV
jgi:hypothetical protein